MDAVKTLFGLGVDAFMVFSPAIGYVDQYKQIQKEKSSAGFSTLISFILIFANILRVFFWFGKRFEMNMLFQSLFMILAQFVMLSVCCKFPSPHQRGKLSDLNFANFWNWVYLSSYLGFTAIFTIVMTLVYGSFIHGNDALIEIVGYAALSLEATLGLPQVFRNFKNKSTQGFSLVLLMTWFAGDAMKTVYFIFKGLPNQFILCGAFQLFVDFVILFQIIAYKNNSNNQKILA